MHAASSCDRSVLYSRRKLKQISMVCPSLPTLPTAVHSVDSVPLNSARIYSVHLVCQGLWVPCLQGTWSLVIYLFTTLNSCLYQYFLTSIITRRTQIRLKVSRIHSVLEDTIGYFSASQMNWWMPTRTHWHQRLPFSCRPGKHILNPPVRCSGRHFHPDSINNNTKTIHSSVPDSRGGPWWKHEPPELQVLLADQISFPSRSSSFK